MGIHPGQDFSLGERRQQLAVSYPAVGGQQLRQGGTARQTPAPVVQGNMDGTPLFSAGTGNGPGLGRGPATGPLVMLIRPGQNLRFGKRRKGMAVTDPVVLGQQLSQGAAA